MLPLGIEPRITAHKTVVITISLWELTCEHPWLLFTYNSDIIFLNTFYVKYFLLFYYFIILLFYYFIILLFYYFIILLFYTSTI